MFYIVKFWQMKISFTFIAWSLVERKYVNNSIAAAWYFRTESAVNSTNLHIKLTTTTANMHIIILNIYYHCRDIFFCSIAANRLFHGGKRVNKAIVWRPRCHRRGVRVDASVCESVSVPVCHRTMYVHSQSLSCGRLYG